MRARVRIYILIVAFARVTSEQTISASIPLLDRWRRRWRRRGGGRGEAVDSVSRVDSDSDAEDRSTDCALVFAAIMRCPLTEPG